MRLIENDHTTTVFDGNGKCLRKAALQFEDDNVVFDCSDGEYGPIRFPLQLLMDKLFEHSIKMDELKYK